MGHTIDPGFTADYQPQASQEQFEILATLVIDRPFTFFDLDGTIASIPISEECFAEINCAKKQNHDITPILEKYLPSEVIEKIYHLRTKANLSIVSFNTFPAKDILLLFEHKQQILEYEQPCFAIKEIFAFRPWDHHKRLTDQKHGKNFHIVLAILYHLVHQARIEAFSMSDLVYFAKEYILNRRNLASIYPSLTVRISELLKRSVLIDDNPTNCVRAQEKLRVNSFYVTETYDDEIPIKIQGDILTCIEQAEINCGTLIMPHSYDCTVTHTDNYSSSDSSDTESDDFNFDAYNEHADNLEEISEEDDEDLYVNSSKYKQASNWSLLSIFHSHTPPESATSKGCCLIL